MVELTEDGRHTSCVAPRTIRSRSGSGSRASRMHTLSNAEGAFVIWRRHYLGLALIVTTAISTAQVETRNISIRYTSPFAGEEMYASYCSACHGDKGKGDGPAAAAMTTAPSDLTTLSKSHNGRFPRTHVYFSILNGKARQKGEQGYYMPSWKGPFYSLCTGQRGCDAEVQMRVVRLTDYLQSLQVK